ncbi:hypothetical protein LTR66_015115 [Elasticomyces elasticus]|nr:hypothetical protein LTR66_015115 [Elasticomyces elasticus]
MHPPNTTTNAYRPSTEVIQALNKLQMSVLKVNHSFEQYGLDEYRDDDHRYPYFVSYRDFLSSISDSIVDTQDWLDELPRRELEREHQAETEFQARPMSDNLIPQHRFNVKDPQDLGFNCTAEKAKEEMNILESYRTLMNPIEQSLNSHHLITHGWRYQEEFHWIAWNKNPRTKASFPNAVSEILVEQDMVERMRQVFRRTKIKTGQVKSRTAGAAMTTIPEETWAGLELDKEIEEAQQEIAHERRISEVAVQLKQMKAKFEQEQGGKGKVD